MEILFGRHDAASLTNLLGLQPLEIGFQDCPPGHAFGPAIREGYLLHFIFSGQGTFRRNGKTSQLAHGEGFLIRAGDLVQYEADRTVPWTYGWILLSGMHTEAFFHPCGLDGNDDTFRFDPVRTGSDCFQTFLSMKHWQAGRDLSMLSAVLRLLAEIQDSQRETSGVKQVEATVHSIDRLCRFISDHHASRISLDRMAAQAGLNPRYLCTVFKNATGLTPYAYLTRVRMTRACTLLRDSDLTIGDIARSVGYDDPLHFSRMFRRMFGTNPKAWRRVEQQWTPASDNEINGKH